MVVILWGRRERDPSGNMSPPHFTLRSSNTTFICCTTIPNFAEHVTMPGLRELMPWNKKEYDFDNPKSLEMEEDCLSCRLTGRFSFR